MQSVFSCSLIDWEKEIMITFSSIGLHFQWLSHWLGITLDRFRGGSVNDSPRSVSVFLDHGCSDIFYASIELKIGMVQLCLRLAKLWSTFSYVIPCLGYTQSSFIFFILSCKLPPKLVKALLYLLGFHHTNFSCNTVLLIMLT